MINTPYHYGVFLLLKKVNMSFIQKMIKRSEELAIATIDVARHHVVPDDVKAERFATCKSCEHFFQPTATCKKCGCFMAVKTSIIHAECPVGKWGKYEPMA